MHRSPPPRGKMPRQAYYDTVHNLNGSTKFERRDPRAFQRLGGCAEDGRGPESATWPPGPGIYCAGVVVTIPDKRMQWLQ